MDEHVPYSTATLTAYLDDVAWAHKQEEIIRLFAADDEEKRYRFPPMKPRQRQFLHNLAEDFALDTESLDPEPHRHIMLFKTPRFVSAPMKTLAQAARIRRGQLNISAPVASSVVEKKDPIYNGFVVRGLKFALTEDELRPIIKKAMPVSQMDIHFLGDEVALLPQSKLDLNAIQPTLSTAIIAADLAANVLQARLDTSSFEPRILDVQTKSTAASAGGWSQVAAAGRKPAVAPTTKAVGQRNVYTVLGSRVAEAKKKKMENENMFKSKEEIVDDWEAEMEKEDLRPGKHESSGEEVADRAEV
ncbi:uncharacterized protein HMPREF1541_06870 [Cyphellophora europaea CBS 101466]|uniref:R3H domain-containing protein n=1 Tax=Cyphellophora europaea (strain CBS 101466) TaxID=1220924 RepID=W2RQP0_CYPE1|nr:uncharacterized protein HMPREF1541_06870 [Cyphellophora europaea CBS 101466]ETN38831.1 hypothetical protein HMPREF1541_06870 [Cyphellophora europaea CBS 101466]